MILGVQSAGRPGAETSRGGAALNILVFVVGSVLIAGAVIGGEKSGLFDRLLGSGAGGSPAQTTPAPEAQDNDVIVPWQPEAQPAPRADNATPPVIAPPTAPKFVGDAQFKFYHRPDCKLVASIAEGKKVAFNSAREAFDKGYIPCKVCTPEPPGPRVETVAPPPERPVRPVSAQLVGDAARRRYHRVDCPLAKSIAADSRVAFRSAADAFARGSFPCRTCDPDLPALIANLPSPPAAPVRPGSLTEQQKRAMYVSLHALKGMLKGIGTTARPYEVLSDRYGVPVSAVQAVEAEGNSKRWPTQ